jgi:hypothetical protein
MVARAAAHTAAAPMSLVTALGAAAAAVTPAAIGSIFGASAPPSDAGAIDDGAAATQPRFTVRHDWSRMERIERGYRDVHRARRADLARLA